MIATADIIGRVRRLLNEAEADEQLSLLSQDTRSIDAHILALLPQAVAMTQSSKGGGCGCVNAKSLDVATAKMVMCDDGGAMLSLPADFVSAVSLQLKGWRRPCTRLLPTGSAEALAQCTGKVLAGTCRPLAVEGVGVDGSRVAFLYPVLGEDPALVHFLYEAEFNADEGLLGCSAQLADAVAYNCAALLYNVFERPDAANMFMSIASVLSNSVRTERR